MFEELIARLNDMLSRVSSRHRMRPGAGGQTIEATAKATIHEITAWDLESVHDAAAALIAAQAEIERLREALSDLVSWLPEKPTEPVWQFKSGEYGADDAVAAARAALAPKE